VVLPLAISYDRIAEEPGFLRELDGSARHRAGSSRWPAGRCGSCSGAASLGRIHIRCGAPLPLDSGSDPGS
jgi:alcohol-forming fatty acyl-CoA reductase